MTASDMSSDLAMTDQGLPDMALDLGPDLPAQGREVGQACALDAQCASGQCRDFGAQRVCTQACQGSCPGAAVCSGGLCTPADYCEDTPAPGQGVGPGCLSCQKCHPAASCIQIVVQGQQRQSCACEPGYQGDGYDCVDLDECASGAHSCHPKADCLNTPGSYTCACKPGYQGDGRQCEVVDPCAACHPDATCSPQRQCICRPGFQGDGASCQDIDECATGQAMCDPLADCLNTPGSYTCTCPTGYQGDGRRCQDIDECATGQAQCDPLATCANSPGSYTCVCPVGATGNGATCQLPSSCAQLKQRVPNTASGLYVIGTPRGPLQVYCDMASDSGLGYTFVRLSDPTLGATQAPYQALCASYGMEVVTPRSAQHMQAIIQYNAGKPPSLVSVVPKLDFAAGLSQWTGRCGGQDCSFFVTDRASARCKTVTGALTNTNPGRFSDGSYGVSCRDYLESAGSPPQTGVYTLDLDGAGPLAPFNAFCGLDPSFDGGGWTLTAISSDDGQANWTWNRRTLWTTNRATIGNLNPANAGRDYKNIALHDLPLVDVLFFHSPSGVWAGYNNVGDGTRSMSQIIASTPFPNCDPSSGYPMSSGTLVATGRLCNTNLYFNPGDFDGSQVGCSTLLGPNDQSTFGPAWSANFNQGCPFDDPAFAGWGPRQDSRDAEVSAQGFGNPLNLNLGSSGTGLNHLQLYVRDRSRAVPDGDNTRGELLTLVGVPTDSSAGPSCPYGSWDDRGDRVEYQGEVICGLN